MRSLLQYNRSLAALLTRYLAYCFIWGQAITACAVFAETDQQRLPVFRVDTQGHTPYEVGAELGRQWKSRFPELEPMLDALLDHRLKGISFTDEAGGRHFPPTRQTDPGGLTEPHQEELEGLMSALYLVSQNRFGDGFLSRDELLLIQQLPDLGAHDSGTAFGVYASRSNTGGALVGRNLDGQPWQEPMERALATITVYRGEGGALVNIGFAGNLGITTGFNQSGLFLAYLPVLGIAIQGVTEAASEPIAFTIRRMLETHERIDTASQALSWPIDGNNYSILMADRERVKVLEHTAGRRGQLRGPSSELQPAMSWGQHKQKIAAVGCFALRAMPSGCSHLREQYRWQRFRTLADLDLQRTGFVIEDIVRIMLDGVGSNDAIYAPTTYQALVFAPDSAELYLGTPATANDPVEPVMHRYAGLIGKPSQESGGILSVWVLLWVLITAIAIVTLWVRLRLRSPTPEAPDE